MTTPEPFHETRAWRQPIRDLGLRIEGTRLEPLLDRLRAELAALGLRHVHPRFYLSSEWGVPSETIAVAIPFYLASEELTRVHEQHSGLVEGIDDEDILRYLRHEMGHVVDYAYLLHDEPGWIEHFGSIDQPYLEDYRPAPFSRRHVRHLPGWYAQMHPEEDWAETFATWATPGLDWRAEYRDWPEALRKLEWCDEVMLRIRDVPPKVTDDSLDEDVGEMAHTLADHYTGLPGEDDVRLPAALDGALRSVFRGGGAASAADLIARLRPELLAEVHRWTGHFPERTGILLGRLTERARALGLGYEPEREPAVLVALTAFVTALASTWVSKGDYSS